MSSVPARNRSAFGQFRMGRSHLQTDLAKVVPRASAGDMAEMLRDGATLAEVAEAFDLSENTIRTRVITGGWHSTTGEPRKKKQS